MANPDNSGVSGSLRVRRTPRGSGKPSRRIRLAVLTMSMLAATASVQAQETGTVRGTVTLAENGGPVDGALILILGTGAFTFTDDGTFEFTNVPAGTYDVLAPAGATHCRIPDRHPRRRRNGRRRLRAQPVADTRGGDRHGVGGGRRRGDAPHVQRGLHRGFVRDRQGGPQHHRRSHRARTRHRQPQFRSRREPAGHPRLRRRSGAHHRGRHPHRRPLRHLGPSRDDRRPEERRADRDRARAGPRCSTDPASRGASSTSSPRTRPTGTCSRPPRATASR